MTRIWKDPQNDHLQFQSAQEAFQCLSAHCFGFYGLHIYGLDSVSAWTQITGVLA